MLFFTGTVFGVGGWDQGIGVGCFVLCFFYRRGRGAGPKDSYGGRRKEFMGCGGK